MSFSETEAATAVGVIGTGAMGGALVRGWSRALGVRARLLVWDTIPSAIDRVAACEGVSVAGSLDSLVAEAGIIVVVVKPKDGEALLRSIAGSLREDHVVISSMAGVELRQIREATGPRPALFRVMPNLGVAVGAGMVAVSAEPGAQRAEALAPVVGLFDSLGAAVVVPENMLDTVTALSGTGPALLALALEGLEDGGVAAGLPRASARAFARRAMLGAARTLVGGEGSAEDLARRLVPSGGALQVGLGVLEERGVRSAFQEAVVAAAQRARDMRAPSSARR
jgi:pyrroline-5-carboxylate reductase